MMNKLIDLRFVIGSFFLLIGLMLLIYHLVSAAGTNVNLWCGSSFGIFGIVMVLLSFQKDAHDEILEEPRSRG